MYRLGDCQAQPPEKSRALHALHHQHHTGNKKNRRPVDAARGLCRRLGLKPEVRNHEAVQAQRLRRCRLTVHTDAKHQHQRQKPASERYDMPLNVIPDDKSKHYNKNNHSQNLCCHLCAPPLSVLFLPSSILA